LDLNLLESKLNFLFTHPLTKLLIAKRFKILLQFFKI
jgi:hypothetical protein